jgi:hypothetical protein
MTYRMLELLAVSISLESRASGAIAVVGLDTGPN